MYTTFETYLKHNCTLQMCFQQYYQFEIILEHVC